jgi:hypothetical protein
MPQDLGAINALRDAKERLFLYTQVRQAIFTFAPKMQSNTVNDLARLHDKLKTLITQIEKNSVNDLRK